ncbi:MAG: hypothetical protein J6V90_04320 [Treponema sp.]|nr:hypothetical protein [Treponema sp.]
MKVRNKMYPYPVLSSYADDYVGSKFDVNASFSMDGYDLKLDFSAELQNNQLMELLKNGSAIIVYHIENPLAGFRNAYETDSLNHSIKIPIRRVKDRVEISSFIIAKKNISNYTNNSFNPDYGNGVSFDIEKGCVLAVANPFELIVPKIQEELKDRNSFIAIIGTEDVSELQVNLDRTDKLVIYLPMETYKYYRHMSNNPAIKQVLVSAIIIPALIYTFEYLKNLAKDDDANFNSRLEDFDWLKALQTILSKQPFEEKDFKAWIKNADSLAWSQKLLNTPITGCIYQLYKMEGNIDED